MHTIIWEFTVRLEKIPEFTTAYQPDGAWSQLFAQADGYQGTELLRSTEDANRYLTIDRWRHADDFARFQERFSEEYRALDTQLEGLTLSERKVGSFQKALETGCSSKGFP